MTPQSIHKFGGFRVQGKGEEGKTLLMNEAKKLQQAGCFALVMECVPSTTAAAVTHEIDIPVIGIGAGPEVNGQVLVLQDVIGGDTTFKPKFLKTYLNGFELIKEAVNRYNDEVKTGLFPSEQESYS